MQQVEGLPIYARIPGEPDRAWMAFQHFRDMPRPRYKKEASEQLDCSPAMLTLYSQQFHWDARILRFDQDEDMIEIEARRQEVLEERKKDRKLMRAAGKSMIVLAVRDLQKWHVKQQRADPDKPILSVKEIALITDVGAKLVRLLDADEELREIDDQQLTKQVMQIGDQEIWFE